MNDITHLIIIVKKMSDFFQSKSTGLREVHVDYNTLDDQNDNVDEVELPCDAFEADGIDILVQNLATLSVSNLDVCQYNRLTDARDWKAMSNAIPFALMEYGRISAEYATVKPGHAKPAIP